MWTGQAIIQPGWALFLGTAGDQSPHRHHAVQIALGVTHDVGLHLHPGGPRSAPGFVIPADYVHQLASGPAPVLLLYLEGESALGRSLSAWCEGGPRPLPARYVDSLIRLLTPPSAVTEPSLKLAVATLGDTSAGNADTHFDERIARLLEDLPRPLPESLSAASLARQCGLSPSRFAHLFRAHAGMPLRPYLRWLRLQQALLEIARGSTLTDAAHSAGFSDSAHLSRTFRATFGIAPRVLLDPALALTNR